MYILINFTNEEKMDILVNLKTWFKKYDQNTYFKNITLRVIDNTKITLGI